MSVRHNPIEVGTMVSSILYNRGRGYVTKIHGEQRPDSVNRLPGTSVVAGGSARFDIVFESGCYSRLLPEAILHGVQWTIHDRDEGFADQEELAALCRRADEAIARQAAEAEAAQLAFDLEVARLRADTAHATLTQGDTGDGAIAAKNIRLLLKAAFPAVKFSVRKRDYGALTVSWADGPDSNAVEAVTDLFRSGHNGTATPWMMVFGHAEYIFTSRS